ncbi:diguanylate cyclase (GGDEF) domain-containing protein [Persephonella hydrogeniphila]|uniref:Diguanylate cyclase (GGDEF) domain-containing protein n=1 Tax=Persephonella hydrogeniphila TaxID=198703 RepID=A0A285NHS1_9AQUI|nr:EAL domain-containing protein [Persephonella hydrogeniphila]SNZ08537.1 diguanylate cyclase (GGDEF) domain-containing protein [Persephonella hydrogeniphila]
MFLDKLLLIFPIRVVFPIFISVVLILVGVFSGYVEIKESTRKLKQEKLKEVCSTAASFQEITEYLGEKGNTEFIERTLINISADPYIDVIFISSPDGKVIFSSMRKYIGKSYSTVIKETIPASYSYIFQAVKNFHRKTALFCKVLEKEGKIVALAPILFSYKEKDLRPSEIGFLFIAYRLDELISLHKTEIIKKILYQFGILFVIFIFVYIGFNKMIGERVNTIIKEVDRISRGELDVKIDLKGKDEFAFIAYVINQLVDRLNRYIKYDYLTGVLNRFGLEREVKRLLSENKDLWNVFIFIDIDNFKEVNDTFGHDVGDILLKKFAKKLSLVANGKVIGRLGGDEFIVFFQSQDKPYVEEMMENWMNELSGNIQIDEQIIHITLTAGVSIKKGEANFYDFLKESDIALYYGKKKGKKMFVIFNEELRLKEEKRIKLTEILKKSLENGDFYLVYQPIASLKTGKVVSVEALLRMKNDELGEVPPSEFIPILEETGLIREVGYWVLSEVCKQINVWSERGIKDISVSVNVDIQQLLDKNFVQNVESILNDSGVNPEKIKIEITESEAMKFPDIVIDVLSRLTDFGIEIAIDDFGTGYSSLSYLKLMPLSYIKIDRAFIKNIPTDKDDNILVLSIVNLAKSLGLKTIAEGVEERVQLLFLKEIGCDYIQGYYFSRPVLPDEIEEIIKTGKTVQA